MANKVTKIILMDLDSFFEQFIDDIHNRRPGPKGAIYAKNMRAVRDHLTPAQIRRAKIIRMPRRLPLPSRVRPAQSI